MITLSEELDPRRGTEAHAIRLDCSNAVRHERPTELELLRLWAAGSRRTSNQHTGRSA
jgi:hypothetical protein